MNATCPRWWLISICSGNGLVPSGNKPLPKLMSTQSSVTICRHWGPMSSGVSKHKQLDCLFDSWLRLSTNKTSNSGWLTHFERNPQETDRFSSQTGVSKTESVSIPWRHHDGEGACPHYDRFSLCDKYSLLMHCIKIKSPAKSLLNEQFVFVGGNIYFLCVLSCSSEEA